jgi:hypothetical protein
MVEQVEILQKLLQTVDTMTALEMSKLIKDPQQVYDRMQEQKTNEYLMYAEVPEDELDEAGQNEEETQQQTQTQTP